MSRTSPGKRAAARRTYDTQEKLAILAEVEKRPDGVSVPQIAAKHGITGSLVYYWIDRHKRGVLDKKDKPDAEAKPPVKRPRRPLELQLAVAKAIATREPGTLIRDVAKQFGVNTDLAAKWAKKHAAAIGTNGTGNQLALAHVAAHPAPVTGGNVPTYVNSSGSVPESIQIALLQRNNGVLKALVRQLLEHL